MCDFCNAMEQKRMFDRIAKEHFPNSSYRYSVAIVQRTFIKGQRGSKGRITDYRNKGIGYKLNYCPECGRKMRGVKED